MSQSCSKKEGSQMQKSRIKKDPPTLLLLLLPPHAIPRVNSSHLYFPPPSFPPSLLPSPPQGLLTPFPREPDGLDRLEGQLLTCHLGSSI